MNGKGDRYRPVDLKKYGQNYDRIFGTPGTRQVPAHVPVRAQIPGTRSR